MYEKLEQYNVEMIPGLGYEIRGIWKDDIHDLRTRIVFDFHNFTLVEAVVEAVKVPFPICQQGLKSIEVLKGQRVGPGLSKVISREIMGKEGCYHLGELALGSVKAVLQAASRERPDFMDGEEYAQRWVEWIDNYKDVCVYFSQPDVNQEAIQRCICE